MKKNNIILGYTNGLEMSNINYSNNIIKLRFIGAEFDFGIKNIGSL